MKLKALSPIIWTDQFDKTLDFYIQILGFSLREINEDWGWASLQKDELEFMVAKPNEHTPFEKPFFTGSFYFNMDNVDEIWNHLKDKVQICYEIENFEWGMREFAFYDNNGYLLQFGQNLIDF